MEKFTVCDDLQNGCNPFRPVRGKRRKWPAKLLRLPVLAVLVPLRLLVGLIAVAFLWVFHLVPVLALRRVGDVIFLRLLLLALGFWRVEGTLANPRKLGIGTRRRYDHRFLALSLLHFCHCSCTLVRSDDSTVACWVYFGLAHEQ